METKHPLAQKQLNEAFIAAYSEDAKRVIKDVLDCTPGPFDGITGVSAFNAIHGYMWGLLEWQKATARNKL